jgi:peptidoglycan hydrolase-like protein with peptidoglycan-binding domain
MKGAPVRDLQRLLGIPADGDFQAGTERAVKAFQSSHGLKPDGIAGPDFWRTARQSVVTAGLAN